MDQWLDWSAFGFLALVTLLDGLRRVSAGAFVFRKVLGGRWEVVNVEEGYRIVSWWPPLTTSLVLSPSSQPASVSVEERLNRVRKGRALLMVLGAMGLVVLLVVVPLAMRRWGGVGFLAALMTVVILSVLTTGASWWAGGWMGLGTRQRLGFALPRLNPFASPAASEALLERSLVGANPFGVARALMTDADFVAWVRPLAYDVDTGTAVDQASQLQEVLTRKEITRLVSTPPLGVGPDSPWCPRCGSEFGPASTQCPSCEVPLRTPSQASSQHSHP